MIRVREMTLDDLEQVVEIENANFTIPWSETGFFTYLLRSDALFLAAEEEGEILGYVGLIMVQPEGDITNVSVKPGRQGQGIGRKLVQEIVRRGAKQGVSTIYLEVRENNESAIHLYESEGFVRDGIRKNYYEQPVENALLMSRRG